jgi:hypothetical protein
MARWLKLAAVLAGYLLAFAAGAVAAWRYDVRVSSLPYDTSGGMYAGGQMMAALGTFLVVSLFPTLLGLWFMRPHPRFWKAVAAAALAFAGAGLVAVLSPLLVRGPATGPALVLLGLLQLAHLLGTPLWIAAFVALALLSPTRPARRLLVAATGVELLVAACALAHWLLPASPP